MGSRITEHNAIRYWGYLPSTGDEAIPCVPDGAAHLLLEGGEGDHPVGGEQGDLRLVND